MEFDRTLLTDNYLIDVVTCIENHGYTVEDFEFTTQRTQGTKKANLILRMLCTLHGSVLVLKKATYLVKMQIFPKSFVVIYIQASLKDT